MLSVLPQWRTQSPGSRQTARACRTALSKRGDDNSDPFSPSPLVLSKQCGTPSCVGPTTTSCAASVSNASSRTERGRCGLSLLKAITSRCCAPAKCANTEARPAARPSPFCATTLTSLPDPSLFANRASSCTSDAGHMMATSTSLSDRASASVSSRRQQ